MQQQQFPKEGCDGCVQFIHILLNFYFIVFTDYCTDFTYEEILHENVRATV